jgi:hypothetical protein
MKCCDKCGNKLGKKYWVRTKDYPKHNINKLCYDCGLELKRHRNAYEWTIKTVEAKNTK